MSLLKIKVHTEIHSDDSWKNAGFMRDLSPIFAISFKRDYLLLKNNKPRPPKSGIVDDNPLIESRAWILN